jgi:predicted nucleic acid-binding protein
MTVRHLVLDTDVLIAGLRSRNGASFRLLSLDGVQLDIQVQSAWLTEEYLTQRATR